MVDEQERQRAVGIVEWREDALEIDMELDRRNSVSGGEPVAVEMLDQDGTPAPPQQRGEALIRHALEESPEAGARCIIVSQGYPECQEGLLLEVLAIGGCHPTSGHRRRTPDLNLPQGQRQNLFQFRFRHGGAPRPSRLPWRKADRA